MSDFSAYRRQASARRRSRLSWDGRPEDGLGRADGRHVKGPADPASRAQCRLPAIAGVAAERLVAAVAGEHDLQLPSGELGDAEGRDRRGVAEGLVVVVGELGQQVHRIEPHDLLDMTGPELLGHGARVVTLVVGLLLEADAEGSDRFGRQLGHQRHDDARVHAAAQECPDGHVATQAETDGFTKQLMELGAVLAGCPGRLGLVVGGPVPFDPWLAAIPDEDAGRRQLVDPHEDAVRGRDVAVLQVARQRPPVDRPLDSGVDEERLELRAPRQSAGGETPVERLLAEAVAGEHQPVAIRVPDGGREHPAHVGRELLAVLLIQVRQHLGVALGREMMPLALELLAQFHVVVDLAVLADPDAAILVGQRLATGVQVDDRQSGRADDGPAVPRVVQVVRPTMKQARQHACDEIGVIRTDAIACGQASDAAHQGVASAGVAPMLSPAGGRTMTAANRSQTDADVWMDQNGSSTIDPAR